MIAYAAFVIAWHAGAYNEQTPQPSEQPIDAEQFWRDRCQACAHSKHPLDGCNEIVGGTFEPDYCPCAVELPYMAAELRRLAAAPDPVASPEADRLIREALLYIEHVCPPPPSDIELPGMTSETWMEQARRFLEGAVATPAEAVHKLATILHQRESAGKARCGPNSRGCRMRHRMDASSILMELTKEN